MDKDKVWLTTFYTLEDNQLSEYLSAPANQRRRLPSSNGACKATSDPAVYAYDAITSSLRPLMPHAPIERDLGAVIFSSPLSKLGSSSRR